MSQQQEHNGWLVKSGKHLLWNVKWRYVVVGRGALIWYVQPDDKLPSGSVALASVRGVRLSAKLRRAHCFEVQSDDHPLYFVAADDTSAAAWIRAIEQQRSLMQVQRVPKLSPPSRDQTMMVLSREPESSTSPCSSVVLMQVTQSEWPTMVPRKERLSVMIDGRVSRTSLVGTWLNPSAGQEWRHGYN